MEEIGSQNSHNSHECINNQGYSPLTDNSTLASQKQMCFIFVTFKLESALQVHTQSGARLPAGGAHTVHTQVHDTIDSTHRNTKNY